MARSTTGRGQLVEGVAAADGAHRRNSPLIEQAVLASSTASPTGNRGQTARAGRRLPHPGRLDPGAGDRPAALRALGKLMARGAGSAIRASRTTSRAATTARCSPSAWAAGARARTRPRRSARSSARGFPAGPSTRRSRRSTIRTCARRGSCASDATSRVCPCARRSRTRRSASPRRPAGIRTRAPQLGEHTDEILARARLSARSDQRAAQGRRRLGAGPARKRRSGACSGPDAAVERSHDGRRESHGALQGLLPGTLGIRFLEVSQGARAREPRGRGAALHGPRRAARRRDHGLRRHARRAWPPRRTSSTATRPRRSSRRRTSSRRGARAPRSAAIARRCTAADARWCGRRGSPARTASCWRS